MKKRRKYTFFWGVGIVIVLLAVLGWLNGMQNKSVLTPMTNEGLESFFQEQQSGVVYIGRPTCPVCREFQPKVEKVSKATGTEVFYYNTDLARQENETTLNQMMEKLQVQAVPTVIYFSEGKEVDRLQEGEYTQEGFEQFLQKHEVPHAK
ncbi:hypothetical protein BVG16_09150 [Paenibacillus selenitireducens]|uniref:Uncharacterized protein n=2 Tax=Paenibacillus selenitireducens TaxID=1324314 RepID=A0A1T2XH80_9BACL|nr:hypothetical protein BVG16_09150 [Paenibacillus selenitireducens]